MYRNPVIKRRVNIVAGIVLRACTVFNLSSGVKCAHDIIYFTISIKMYIPV